MLKKGIWFVLHMVAVTILAVSLVLGVISWDYFGYQEAVLKSDVTYEYSQYLLNDLQYESDIIWNYFEAKQTLKVLGEEKTVTIEDVYKILIDMGLSEEDIQILVDEFGLTVDGLYDFLTKKFRLTEADIYAFLDEHRIEERLDEEIVYDLVHSAETTSDIYNEASASEDIAWVQEQVAYGENRYYYENTNVRYAIMLEDELIDSNLPEELEEYSSVVFADERNGYILNAYLNTDYPVQDYYYEMSQNYNQFQNIKWILFGSTIASVLMILISLITLTSLAGRRKGSKEIALSWVDRPPLEIALAVWGVLAFVVAVVLGIFARYVAFETSLFWLIVFMLAVLAGSFLSMTGYLSLVRRIKSRTLGRNSLCYKIAASILGVVRNILNMTSVSQKIMAASVGYLIFMILLALIGTGFGILLMCVISTIVLYILYKDTVSRQLIIDGMKKITSGELDYQIDLSRVNHLQMEVAESANQVGTSMKKAVQQSLKDERLKTDLITNVSHDIKTPLTSIINYVDLLKREDIQNENAKGYLEILDQKSQRLKQLTEDLVEASKLSSGNVILNMEKMDFNEILQQALGEFEEKFASKNLQVVLKRPDGQVAVMGEGRRIWRILENLFQNVYKYAMPGTRVYAELVKNETEMIFTLKNISQHSLNIDTEDLTERFIRGDVSRTTEGSGLGLSIARDLATLQKGGFDIHLDGDLFKAILRFELINDMRQ